MVVHLLYHDKFGDASTYCGQILGVGDDTQTLLINQISFNIDCQLEIGSHRTAQPSVCRTFHSLRCLMDMADATATLLVHISHLSRQLPFLTVDFAVNTCHRCRYVRESYPYGRSQYLKNVVVNFISS
jgi:hypothetical protein